MILNLKQLINGTKADANDINEIAGNIMGVVNGNIDKDNIKAGAINRDKLETDSVTESKIVNGSVTENKLGIKHTQSKNGASFSQGYIKLGNVLIQYGRDTMTFSGTEITYPMPFSKEPIINLTTRDPNNHPAWISANSATKFTGKQAYRNNGLAVYWIAIGEA